MYQPNDQGLYDVWVEGLQVLYEILEEDVITKVLASRPTRTG